MASRTTSRSSSENAKLSSTHRDLDRLPMLLPVELDLHPSAAKQVLGRETSRLRG